MEKRFARKGFIPEIGEVWQPIGEKQQLFMVFLLDIDRVRPFIPEKFKILSVLPGKTLGYIFMGYFGPQSTLEYHEFIVAPAVVEVDPLSRTKNFKFKVYPIHEINQSRHMLR